MLDHPRARTRSDRIHRRICRARGYALIFALIALVMVSLAASVVLQNARQDGRRERERQLLFVGEQFRAAIASYFSIQQAKGLREYPRTLEDLVEDKRAPQIRRHLRRIYLDPMTNQADWVLDTAGGRIVGVHSRSEGVPVLRAGFTPVQVGFAGAHSYAQWTFLAGTPDAPEALAEAGGGNPGSRVPDEPSAGDGSFNPDTPATRTRAQCFTLFVQPATLCEKEPPPVGEDMAACQAYYLQEFSRCMSALNASPQ